MNNNRHIPALIASTWFLGNLGIYFLLPYLPTLAQQFHTSARLAQYSIALFLVGKAFGVLLCGPLAEKYGRRIFMLAGLALYIIGSLMRLFATNIHILLITRFIQGLGVSATVLMGRVIINDRYKQQKAAKMFSHLFLFASIIIAILPLLAGITAAHLPWQWAFIIMAGYSFILLALSLRWLSETGASTSRQAFKLKHLLLYYKSILTHPVFLGYVVCSVFMVAGESAFRTASSYLFIQQYGLNTEDYGFILSIIAFGHLFGTFLCGRVSERYSLSKLMGIGVISLLIAAILMTLLSVFHLGGIWSLVVPMFIFYLGTGFILTISAAGVVTPFSDLISLSSSASLFLYFSFSALGSYLISHFSVHTQLPTVLLILVVSIIATFSWRLLIVPNKL